MDLHAAEIRMLVFNRCTILAYPTGTDHSETSHEPIHMFDSLDALDKWTSTRDQRVLASVGHFRMHAALVAASDGPKGKLGYARNAGKGVSVQNDGSNLIITARTFDDLIAAFNWVFDMSNTRL